MKQKINKHKKHKIVSAVLILLLVIIGSAALALYCPRSLANELPEDTSGITSIAKVANYTYDDIMNADGSRPVLDSEYYDEFIELARKTQYIKFYNFVHTKSSPQYEYLFVINYSDGKTLILAESFFHDNNPPVWRIRYSYLTVNPYPEMKELFAAHSFYPNEA